MNPYTLPSEQQYLLRPETLSIIYAKALHAAVEEDLYPEATPTQVPLQQLKSLYQVVGPDLYTLPAEKLMNSFAGITHAIYQAIYQLYCSKDGRSIAMVWHILQRMAHHVGASPLSYEAVWAICLSLERQRRSCLDVNIERNQQIWWIGSIVFEIECIDRELLHRSSPLTSYPHIVCLVDMTKERPLAFHLLPANEMEAQEESLLVLYDAFFASRHPAGRFSQNYVWSLPAKLLVADDQSHLLRTCRLFCQRLGIHMEIQSAIPSEFYAIKQSWEQGLRGRKLSRIQCYFLFEDSLWRAFGYSPEYERRSQELHPLDLVGTHIDPAFAFPILRALLPEREGSITAAGTICYKHRHYMHPLLCYWANQPITFRLSVFSEKTIWVYWRGETLCQAQSP